LRRSISFFRPVGIDDRPRQCGGCFTPLSWAAPADPAGHALSRATCRATETRGTGAGSRPVRVTIVAAW
jgi:hypothetical protein